ncbi:hypothetical protein GJ496_009629 [Pomphorhynchus laevis]|nr:hypothetical protein GJ496_009629 [Pomphorhynchus laevis]
MNSLSTDLSNVDLIYAKCYSSKPIYMKLQFVDHYNERFNSQKQNDKLQMYHPYQFNLSQFRISTSYNDDAQSRHSMRLSENTRNTTTKSNKTHKRKSLKYHASIMREQALSERVNAANSESEWYYFLNYMRKESHGCDMLFIVKSIEFAAHKCVVRDRALEVSKNRKVKNVQKCTTTITQILCRSHQKLFVPAQIIMLNVTALLDRSANPGTFISLVKLNDTKYKLMPTILNYMYKSPTSICLNNLIDFWIASYELGLSDLIRGCETLLVASATILPFYALYKALFNKDIRTSNFLLRKVYKHTRQRVCSIIKSVCPRAEQHEHKGSSSNLFSTFVATEDKIYEITKRLFDFDETSRMFPNMSTFRVNQGESIPYAICIDREQLKYVSVQHIDVIKTYCRYPKEPDASAWPIALHLPGCTITPLSEASLLGTSLGSDESIGIALDEATFGFR